MDADLIRTHLVSGTNAQIISALRFMAQNGKLSDLQSILAHVNSKDADIKQHAITAATAIIRNHLTTRFNELDALVREKLGMLLNSLSSSVIDEISKDLFSEEESRKLRALQILGLLKKNPRVRDILADMIQDRNAKIRATAVSLLAKVVSFGEKDQQLILSLLNDKDKRVRANTIEALEALGNYKVVPVLLRFRNDPNNRIRGNVLKALYRLGHPDIEDDLMTMLSTNDHFMKASALWVVSQVAIKSSNIENAAGYHLLSENEMVVNNARKALTAMATPRAQGYLRYLDPAVVISR